MHQKSSRRANSSIRMAPYRKQIISNARNKPGLLSKIKTFFSQIDPTKLNGETKVTNDRVGNKLSGRRVTSIPGGYFQSDALSDSSFHRSEAATTLQEGRSCFGNNEELCDETNEANVSNAKLANFFSKKGNEPLSEIEMEGVMSLLQRSNKSMIAPEREQKLSENSNADQSLILKETGSTPINISNTPTFNPKYDSSVVSNASMNTTLGNIGSRKYSFNYSSLPSPYKTTVYRYSVAKKMPDTGTANTSVQSIASVRSARAGVSKPASTKKISNTAAALVSLLDEKDIKRNNPASQLANPYSSYVSQIRKHKKGSSNFVTGQEMSQESSVKSLSSEKVLEQSEELVKQSNNTKISPPAQNKDSFAKYKPARSSSLRSNVVVAETSPEKKETVAKAPSSTFNFSFNGAKKEEPSRGEYKSENAPRPLAEEFVFTKLQTKPLFEKPKSEMTKVDSSPIEPNFSVTPQKNVSNSFIFNSVQKKTPSHFSQQNGGELGTTQTTVGKDISMKELQEFDFNIPVASKSLGNGSVDENKVEAFKSLYTF
ncbi:hypothetical protein SUVZ_01G0650 [Saccharomyces uvarum]|uniref:Nucleoporin NUP60 n=1 Tax=Saccharomyces uvarum TaxID=230603 RepID=A0ABN8WMP9_SACUV|nr:hypothetical protein SUVZ_01G0650 [Saccharomyces uvarum]